MPDTPSMTVAEAMGSIPEVIGERLRTREFARCFSDAGLQSDFHIQTGNYIPEVALDRFLHSAAHRAGDDFLGASLAQSVSVQDYGVWGDYVLEAPTLLSAMSRASSIIHLHADNDTLKLRRRPKSVRFEYGFAERGGKGYRQIAMAAFGPLTSIPRYFLGQSWKPQKIGIDLEARGAVRRLEREFDCAVRARDSVVSIEIPNSELLTANPTTAPRRTTREDVVRACSGGPPKGIVPIMEQLLLQRVGIEDTGLESLAEAINVSKRTLQRRLDREGIDFRSLSLSVRMRRAQELLAGTDLDVSEIATHLEYSTPGHFARAFRQSFDVAPSQYRNNVANPD
ncbi:AraC family transcriptional regulator [Shimia thalassica]|uniref:AraC family transcriptional regulator n=1 Tax=Shimia thalassica TaxID=1715693 RepID=UPI0024957B3B|nr:AraC family transcriptional regulator [Shimia thalassica]